MRVRAGPAAGRVVLDVYSCYTLAKAAAAAAWKLLSFVSLAEARDLYDNPVDIRVLVRRIIQDSNKKKKEIPESTTPKLQVNKLKCEAK
jgi:hypothetical protein